MKSIKLFYAVLIGAILLIVGACNKGEDDFFYKDQILTVNLTGFNASSEQLDVKIDTFKFKYPLSANQAINQSDAYIFPENRTTAKLTITEMSTGKFLLERELKKNDGLIATINLFYMDGKVSEMPKKPAIEEGKIKLIYMFRPTSTKYTEPVDIAIGKFWQTPAVFEEITRVKNVKPNEFSEPIALSTFSTAAGQQYNGQPSFVSMQARIYKAGTNELYTVGTGSNWDIYNSAPPVPNAESHRLNYIFLKKDVRVELLGLPPN